MKKEKQLKRKGFPFQTGSGLPVVVCKAAGG